MVTGTEVITGRISDANGPWVSERLADLGVEVAHIIVVADRPDDLEDALRFLAAEEMDLIVTSGGLGPTADDLTAEIVGRFAGRPMPLDEDMEAKIREILRRFARNRSFKFDEEAVMEANRKQAMVPEGAEALDPIGTAPGLVVPAGERVVIVLPGPPRELQPMWPRALATDAVQAVLARATPLHGLTMRMFGVPESEIAKSLREIEDDDGVDVEAVEVTTCLRRGEIEIDVRWRDETEATAMAVRDGLQRRHQRETFSLDGTTIDEQVAKLLKGHKARAGGVVQRRPAGGADHQRAGGLGLLRRERRHLLLRGQRRASGRAEGAAGGVRRGFARGRRGDGQGRAGALRRRRRGLDHRDRRVRAGEPRRSRSATSASTRMLADGTTIAREPVIPGDRADIRERSGLVAMHLLRDLLS